MGFPGRAIISAFTRYLYPFPLLDFQLFDFSGYFRSTKVFDIPLRLVAYPVKNQI